MSLLLQNLILSSLGDIALVIGEQYEKYLEPVLRVLKQAMQLSVTNAASQDDEFVDYNHELRLGIIDAYSGIMQGLGSAKCEQYLKPEVAGLVEFASSIGTDADPDLDVCKSAVDMLGDICSVMTEWLKLVNTCKQSSHIQEDCEWAVQQIEGALRS
eukprot:gene4677-14877_t